MKKEGLESSGSFLKCNKKSKSESPNYTFNKDGFFRQSCNEERTGRKKKCSIAKLFHCRESGNKK